MEQHRLILVIALSFLALLLWEAWQRDYGPREAAPALPTTVTSQRADERSPAAQQSLPAIPKTVAEPTQPAGGPGQHIAVTTDLFQTQINLTGGVIDRAALRNYPDTSNETHEPFAFLDASDVRFFIYQSGLKANSDSPDHYAAYTASAPAYQLAPTADRLDVDLLWQSPDGVRVTKRLSFTRGSYKIEVHYLVENHSSAPWTFHHYEQLQREHVEVRQYFTHTFTGAALSSPEQRYEKFAYKNLVEQPIQKQIKNGWIAILEHYFVAALIPNGAAAYQYYSSLIGQQNYAVGFFGPEQSVPPGGSLDVSSALYLGPKLQGTLPSIAPGLELTVDYGALWFIGKLLFWIMAKLHALFGNWGWSIILLTCIVKLVFFPLSAAGYRSMAKMRRVQPRLLALRERYSSDRARLNQAMMELYKEEKINPLGGCLPIVIQIPVFISLYWVILESVELRQAPWIFWISDLSVKDPRFVLPVLMTISMWLQSKLNPAPLDPIQARVMQIMPFAFGVFFAFFPAGLVLYWFVNNVLSIGQQWFITRATEKA
jgi:YidC/Oxa1 family membrane protein insertase